MISEQHFLLPFSSFLQKKRKKNKISATNLTVRLRLEFPLYKWNYPADIYIRAKGMGENSPTLGLRNIQQQKGPSVWEAEAPGKGSAHLGQPQWHSPAELSQRFSYKSQRVTVLNQPKRQHKAASSRALIITLHTHMAKSLAFKKLADSQISSVKASGKFEMEKNVSMCSDFCPD